MFFVDISDQNYQQSVLTVEQSVRVRKSCQLIKKTSHSCFGLVANKYFDGGQGL